MNEPIVNTLNDSLGYHIQNDPIPPDGIISNTPENLRMIYGDSVPVGDAVSGVAFGEPFVIKVVHDKTNNILFNASASQCVAWVKNAYGWSASYKRAKIVDNCRIVCQYENTMGKIFENKDVGRNELANYRKEDENRATIKLNVAEVKLGDIADSLSPEGTIRHDETTLQAYDFEKCFVLFLWLTNYSNEFPVNFRWNNLDLTDLFSIGSSEKSKYATFDERPAIKSNELDNEGDVKIEDVSEGAENTRKDNVQKEDERFYEFFSKLSTKEVNPDAEVSAKDLGFPHLLYRQDDYRGHVYVPVFGNTSGNRDQLRRGIVEIENPLSLSGQNTSGLFVRRDHGFCPLMAEHMFREHGVVIGVFFTREWHEIDISGVSSEEREYIGAHDNYTEYVTLGVLDFLLLDTTYVSSEKKSETWVVGIIADEKAFDEVYDSFNAHVLPFIDRPTSLSVFSDILLSYDKNRVEYDSIPSYKKEIDAKEELRKGVAYDSKKPVNQEELFMEFIEFLKEPNRFQVGFRFSVLAFPIQKEGDPGYACCRSVPPHYAY
jgi:hypothetical protein